MKVYTTYVTIDGTHAVLKPGMSAKVEILVDRLHDVKIVPVQVVENRDGRKFCYVATESGPEEREVVTGEFNNTFVEIVSGLQVGEKVLLSPPRGIEHKTDSETKPQQSPDSDQQQDNPGKEGQSTEQPVSTTST